MIALRTILVATDFSEPSDTALRHARALTDAFKASLHVLHVVIDPIRQQWVSDSYGQVLPDLTEQLERDA